MKDIIIPKISGGRNGGMMTVDVVKEVFTKRDF
jgi:hypothetical protein